MTLSQKIDLHSILGSRKAILFSAFLLVLITFLPQLYLNYSRGSQWNGSCAYLDTDELAYAAYLNALIEGRPRRNDPFTGNDGGSHETLFSIQFVPPYLLAIPARALHLSANTMLMLLLPLATLAAFFSVWLIVFEVTGKRAIATAGAIGVLSFGTAAAHSPILIWQGLETGYDLFPFLRRYIPAVPFSVFLLFTLFVWRSLTRHSGWAIVAAISFASLMFSYFFLWTGALAWLFTLLLLWLIFRPHEWKKTVKVSVIFGVLTVPALLFYAWLLSQRANNIESGQLLELTHVPDLLRAPELYGAVALCVIGYQLRRKLHDYGDKKILFTAAFALAPFVVFNHQIVTGRSLQPFHYEEFVANYLVVLAAFLILGLRRKIPSHRIILYLMLGGLGVALILGVQASRLSRDSNVRFDEVREVSLELKRENLRGVVFASDFRLTNSIATTTQNPVLWSRFLYTFANTNAVEQKRRYYQQLYFSGVNEDRLKHLLNTDFFARWEVFGADRANPMLSANHIPITPAEIDDATQEYAAFMRAFDQESSKNPLLSYAIVSQAVNLSNLDRWYERDQGKQIGNLTVFRLSPKVSN